MIDAQTLTHIRGLHLPPLPGKLTIASDGDVPGRWAGEYRFCLPLMAGIGTTFFS